MKHSIRRLLALLMVFAVVMQYSIGLEMLTAYAADGDQTETAAAELTEDSDAAQTDEAASEDTAAGETTPAAEEAVNAENAESGTEQALTDADQPAAEQETPAAESETPATEPETPAAEENVAEGTITQEQSRFAWFQFAVWNEETQSWDWSDDTSIKVKDGDKIGFKLMLKIGVWAPSRLYVSATNLSEPEYIGDKDGPYLGELVYDAAHYGDKVTFLIESGPKGSILINNAHCLNVKETEHGQVQLGNDVGEPGNRISIKVIPDAGYELERLTVWTDEETPTRASLEKTQWENYFYLYMPETDATVVATFKPEGSRTDTVEVEKTKYLDAKLAIWNEESQDWEWTDGNSIKVKDGDQVRYVIRTTAADTWMLEKLYAKATNIDDPIYFAPNYKAADGYGEFTYDSFQYGDKLTILTESGPAGKIYTVTAHEIEVLRARHGRVEASAWFANTGVQRSLTVYPDEGYELDTLTVMTAGENPQEVEVTKADSSTKTYYTFIMPDSDVTVQATFKIAEYPITLVSTKNATLRCDKTSAKMGEKVTVEATPGAHQKIIYLGGYSTSDGQTLKVEKLNQDTITFRMPASGVRIFSNTDNRAKCVVKAEYNKYVNVEFGVQNENGEWEWTSDDRVLIDSPQQVRFKVRPTANAVLHPLRIFAIGNKEGASPEYLRATNYSYDGDYWWIDFDESRYGDVVTILTKTGPSGPAYEIASSQHEIDTLDSEHGSLSVNTWFASAGTRVTLRATPDPGYELDRIIVKAEGDNPEVTEGYKADSELVYYYFYMLDSDVTVQGIFRPADKYLVYVDETAEEHAAVKPETTEAAPGDKVKVELTPDKNYELRFFYFMYTKDGYKMKDDIVQDEDGSYYFTMPEASVTVYAYLEEGLGGASHPEVTTEPQNPQPQPDDSEASTTPISATDQDNIKPVIVAKAIAKGKTKAKITWNKVSGADRYVIYYAKCGGKWKRAKTVSGSKTSWTKKGLRKNTAYKFYVVAQKKSGSSYSKLASSNSVHMVTGNVRGKYTNPKSLKLTKSSYTIKKGKTANIKAKVYKMKGGKKLLTSHSKKLRYVSSDTSIAKVNSKGNITAVNPGSCKIYVQTINGIWKTVTVRVN